MNSFLTFGVREDKEELRDQMNTILKYYANQGTLANLKNKWIVNYSRNRSLSYVMEQNKVFYVAYLITWLFVMLLLIILKADYSRKQHYIETLLEMPWDKASKDSKDIERAREILEADHYGLEKVKERILEFLSVRILTKKGDSPILCLVGPPGTGKTSIARSIAKALDKKMRLPADAKSFISKEVTEYVLYEDTRYRNVQGIARMKKDGAQISGDNFSFLEMDRGELLLGLSDGMGSGSMACKESEMVLDLLERFLEAGFSVETAIRMMNSAMVMRGDNDLYSTVDLCKVNLYTGVADFYKIGAAAAFIRHGNEVECIASSSLPVGAQTQFEIEKQQRKLQNGDFVVMVTDGVLEYLHVPKPEETMQEMIESIETNNPGILAKRIMERVMLFTGGKAADDMTVLAACIWEK